MHKHSVNNDNRNETCEIQLKQDIKKATQTQTIMVKYRLIGLVLTKKNKTLNVSKCKLCFFLSLADFGDAFPSFLGLANQISKENIFSQLTVCYVKIL